MASIQPAWPLKTSMRSYCTVARYSRFRERVIEPEWLDDKTPEEARASLADLTRLNRDWGGYSSLRRLIERSELPHEPFSVLDVGAASGGMGSELRRLRPAAKVTSLDYVAHHLNGAPQPKIVADAFRMPFAAASFDYVLASLFLHHFENEQVIELLSSFKNITRRGVLVVDLERRTIPYYFIPLTRPVLKWDPITVHDGPVSVAAGFRREELGSLAVAAGLVDPDVLTHGLAFRVTMFGRTP